MFCQQGTETWLALRASLSLTSSNFGTALGLNRYQSRRKLYHNELPKHHNPAVLTEKELQQAQRQPEISPEVAEAGLAAEALAQRCYCATWHESFRPEHGIWLVLEDPQYAASPDGVTTSLRLWECKHPMDWTPLYEEPKLTHLCQIYGQMAATNVHVADYFVWKNDDDWRNWEVEWDPSTWQAIHRELRKFHQCVLNRTPPPNSSKALVAEWRRTLLNSVQE